jgi:2-dehydro-3-deoxyphosphooctonate aldolase (KDO 8-P synthase)
MGFGARRFATMIAPMVIAGPCVIETEETALLTANKIAEVAQRLKIPIFYKSSFDKANRTSITSPRGPGIEEGLRILEKVKAETGLPILTDVHETWQVPLVAECAEILQIPAFLCRQTELIMAAAASGRIVNIKKGQFLAPEDMRHIVAKAATSLPKGQTAEQSIMLTERGTSFGYHDLVVDMRGLAIMRESGCPIIFDATHSVQRPSGQGNVSGGNREFIPLLTRAAAAAGVDGLFVETHPDPEKSWSDAATSWPLDDFERLVSDFLRVHALASDLGNS